MRPGCRNRWIPLAALAVLALLGPGQPALAGDVTAFVAAPTPGEVWSRGYGAALSSTWFQVLSFEGEAARVRGDLPDTTMTSFTAAALLAPPIGGLIPYGGLGVGLYRQTAVGESDTGTLRALILGGKIRIKNLLVLKAEYRSLDLPDDSLLPMDERWSIGAGIAF